MVELHPESIHTAVLTRQVVGSQTVHLLPRNGGEATQVQIRHLESKGPSGGDMYVMRRFEFVREAPYI